MATNDSTSIQLELPFDNTIIIPLTQGQFTIIDMIDADLADHKWFAQYNSHYANGGNFVAGRQITIGKKKQTTEYLHRVIMSRILGRPLLRSELVDHEHGDPLLNIRSELRLATVAQNNMNRGKQSSNTSGYKGVSWHKQHCKWQARISKDNKRIHLGYFDTREAASVAYWEAALSYHGDFARLE